MKKKMSRLMITGAACASFLVAPLITENVLAEGNELNYTTGITEKVEIASPFSQLTNSTVQHPTRTKGDTAEKEASIVEIAYEYEATPYSFGGTTPAAFDYSGYVFYVYEQAGKEIPRTVAAQYSLSEKVSQTEAEPGDLVFFSQTGRVDHVGIYLGDGEFISAQTKNGVEVASLSTGYWSNHIVGYGRVK